MNSVHCTVSILYITIFTGAVLSATTHKHNYGGSKERFEDGSYRPRDADHHHNGEHNSEFDHEAIIGSVKEAEEFDNLSAEESKQRLGILVTKMDLNSDGYVDRHEMKAWILRSFKSLSQEEADERFDDIDENKDNYVTWLEYLSDTYGMDSEERSEIDPNMEQQINEEDKLIADDKEMFLAADLDNDGRLIKAEFVLFMSPEENPQMLPIILSQTLRDKDKDGDKKISFSEFVGDVAAEHDKEWLLSEKEKFDNEHDLDGDGFLNSNEILSWVVPSKDEVAVDEVDHLFVSADEDHDDRLSYKEIIDNHDIFVGSEATDYGDHLQNIHHFQDEL